MLGNFVSLFDVLEAVSCRVPVTDEEVDAYRSMADDKDAFLTMLNRAPVRKCFSDARAAFRLVDLFTNCPANLRPRWFDVEELGFPLHREVVSEEGLQALILIARRERDYIEQYSKQRFLRWGQGQTSDDAPTPVRNPAKLPRICNIGFDRNELIAFLDKNGLPHSLGILNAPLETDPAFPVAEHSTDPENATPRWRPNFRGIESEVLYMAWERARDKSSAGSVFDSLIELARSPSPKFPLLGYIPDEEAVKMLKYSEKQEEEVYFFKLADMRSRMRNAPKPKKRT